MRLFLLLAAVLLPSAQAAPAAPQTFPSFAGDLNVETVAGGLSYRPKKPSGRHAARLRRDGITARLSCSFNFLATRVRSAV
jgi:hypothetical protein